MMKKIILLFTITLCVFTGRAQLFSEDFELTDSVISSGNLGWFQNNRLSVGGSFCDSSSIQNVGDTSILSTLFFDCSTAAKVFLSFDHICKIDFFDRAIIEVSNDNGNTFVQLDSSNCSYTGHTLSWSFTNSLNVLYSNWLPGIAADNSRWSKEVFNLSALFSFHSSVMIRFKLYDNNNNGGAGNPGWFIDNLKVDSIAPPDAGVVSILNFDPTSIANSQHPVDVLVKNYGADTAYSFNVNYSLNGGAAIIQPWTGILSPGDSVLVILAPVTIPSGPFGLCAFTYLPGDIDHSNDTICISGNGLALLPVPYADDFEGANAGWLDPNPGNTPTLWELGTPNYGVTNSAHSGTRSWDTNLDTSYLGPCNAVLYTPYFDFSTIGTASVSFWQNRKTEPLSDGLRLEYNINSTGWQTLGLANNPYSNNWYTDSLILASSKPGWEGNSNGWIQSSYPLPGSLANQASVQFRFVFTADNAVDNDGVSIDDFSISLTSCGNSIYSSTNQTACGDSLSFGFTPSSGIASVFWDLGNGITSTQPAVNGFFTFGTYTVMLYTVDSNGCSASSLSQVNVTTGFSVSAGPDVLSCNFPAQLNITPTVAGAYTYNWSPVAGLNNPFIPNPQASHVDSLTYTITVIDTVTGCIANDQIMVSAYSPYNDQINICLGGAAILDLGPGATLYSWTTFMDTLGNSFPIGVNTQAYFVTQPGTYYAAATFPFCGLSSNQFFVKIDTNCITDVWPGDCNYDLIADNNDLLNIGVAYGDTGSIRPSANNTWTAQPCPDWLYYFAAGINEKHSDCNGDGVVDTLDIPVILQNYGLNHPLKLFPPPPSSLSLPVIYLTADVDTAGISDTIIVTVNLGTTAIPVDSIYGIAYTINYESAYIDSNSASADFSNSWIGTIGSNAITLEKHFSSQGYSDFAIVRRDHLNAYNGSGGISRMTIVTTDNLSGKSILHLNISDVKAITFSENIIPLTTLGDSVVLDPNYNTGVAWIADNDIRIYPNPVTSDLMIKSNHTKIISIELKNALGQQVIKTNATGVTTRINVAELPQGIFFLSVLTDKGVISKKVQVIK